MRILGIDIGSRLVKLAIFNSGELEAESLLGNANFYRNYCLFTEGKLCLNYEKLNLGHFDKVVSTGYEKNNINIEGAEVITEFKAHVLGSVWQTGLKDFTLLDVGGQDSKVIFAQNGIAVDAVINDNCASACGRYLENMAAVLSIPLSELDKHFGDPAILDSTCAVFAETEIIGRMSEGCSINRLAAGVNYSLFRRIKPLIERFPGEILILSGGVAKSKAIKHFIEKEMNFSKVMVLPRPQINGAIGCCVHAMANIRF